MNTTKDATRILCYGDSNTWGWVPGKLGAERFNSDIRWPTVMQQKLGNKYEVIEDALGARTTAYDDPNPALPLRNGLQTLPIALETHLPIDILVLMLGTADCKQRLGLSAQDIASGMRQLVETAKNYRTIANRPIKHIIIVAPAVINGRTELMQKLFGDGAEQKSRDIVELYKTIDTETGCTYFDANTVAKVDPTEGIHMTSESQLSLGEAMAISISKLPL